MNCPILILNLYMQFLSLRCYFLYITYLDTDTALKVSQSVCCFTTSISHGVKNYFPRLWVSTLTKAGWSSNFCTDFSFTITPLFKPRNRLKLHVFLVKDIFKCTLVRIPQLRWLIKN